MKKCIKYFLVMFGLMIGFIVNANAVQAATLNMNNSDYWYYRANGDGSNEHSWHFTLYEVDGEVAYCIEPNIPEGTSYSQGSWEQTGLPNSIKERILLIGYYGYTYPGHQTIEFRQHQGTTDFKKISMWAKFCIKLVEWSLNNRLECKINKIEDIPFLNKTEKAYFARRANELSNL